MQYKKILIELGVFFSLALIFSGCGYHFQADGEPVGVDIPSLAIPLMESTSSALGFEADFTKVFRDEFISHSNVPLVPRDEAAIVLIGKRREIRTYAPTYDITQTNVRGDDTYYAVTNSRHLGIVLDARLLEKATGKTIWKEDGMEEQARYVVTDDPLTNRYNEKIAVEKIARRLVDRLYLKTMERF